MNNNPNNINQMNRNNGTVNQNVNNINNAVQAGMQMGRVNQNHIQTVMQPMQGQNVMPNQNIGQVQNPSMTGVPPQNVLNSQSQKAVQMQNVSQQNQQNVPQSKTTNSQQVQQNNIEMVDLSKKSASEDFSDKTISFLEKIINTKDYTNTFTKEEVVPFRILATMCYIPFLFLLPLLSGKYKKSRFLYFHINQGLNITLAWSIVFFFNKVFRSLFTTTYRYSSVTPGWVNFISYMLYCLVIAITAVGMVNTFNGKSKNTSIVGGFRFLK